jgi:hypothetical protein
MKCWIVLLLLTTWPWFLLLGVDGCSVTGCALQALAAECWGAGWVDRFGDEPRKGCDVLVQALEREGVTTLFAYPGGASMEIHQALTRSPIIRNVLCRHEQVWRGRAD